MAKLVPEIRLRQAGWSRGPGGAWYWFFPSDHDTHIHLGGSNVSGNVNVTFVSLKLGDQFAGHFFNAQKSDYCDRGSLEGLPERVATHFRKGLNAIGLT